jgi:hypothetical protein
VKLDAEGSETTAQGELSTAYSRAEFFLSGVLDSVFISLFYFPFSSLTPVLSAAWCRFLAEE